MLPDLAAQRAIEQALKERDEAVRRAYSRGRWSVGVTCLKLVGLLGLLWLAYFIGRTTGEMSPERSVSRRVD